MAKVIAMDSHRDVIKNHISFCLLQMGQAQRRVIMNDRKAEAMRVIRKLEAEIDLYKAMLSSAT